jgi:hypothetical protein
MDLVEGGPRGAHVFGSVGGKQFQHVQGAVVATFPSRIA